MKVALFATALLAGTAVAAQPAAGDLYDVDVGHSLRGWQYESMGARLEGPPYATFRLGRDHLVAEVEEVAPARQGRRAVYRIVRTLAVRAAPGEQVMEGFDCPFINTSPVVTFYSSASHIARGVFVLNGEIRMMRWFVDEPLTCVESGD